MNIGSASNPTLGVNGQELCQVCLNFTTDAIVEIDIKLIAPNGSSVLLVAATGLSTNNGINFDICFIACSEIPDPEPGHQAVFANDDGWVVNSMNGGTYHPSVGCLEDLSGPVDGNWTIEITDFVFIDDTDLFDWHLVFADDNGLNCAHAADCGSCEADAGIININNNPACPDEIISFLITEYNTTPQFDQYVIITDQSDIILDFVQGDTYAYTYDHCEVFTVYSYNLEIGGGSTIPSIGDDISLYDCITNCCDLENESFSFEDNIPPTFVFVPDHPNFPGGGPFLAIFCLEDIPLSSSASYTDNCIAPGMVNAVDEDLTDPCLGGNYIRTWSIGDSCTAFPTVETQVITVEPRPLGVYINPPADITVLCDNIPVSAADLTYSNGLSNSCASMGIASPEYFENYDLCGGIVTFTWRDIDECNRIIEYIQTITIVESPKAHFIDPPVNITVSCDNIPASGPDLLVSNELFGSCLIEDIVSPIETNNYNGCEGEIKYTWSYTDLCGRILSYTQTITIMPAPIPVFVNTPLSITVSCEDVATLQTELFYTNSITGDCGIVGSVDAIQSGNYNECGGNMIYRWEYIDNCNRSIVHEQSIVVEPSPPPSFLFIPDDITIDCGDADFIPEVLEYSNNSSPPCTKEGFINGVSTRTGNTIQVEWSVNLSCDGNILSASQTITLPTYSLFVDSVICSSDLMSYTVFLHSSETDTNTITASSGTVENNGFGNYKIMTIASNTDITIDGISQDTLCKDQIVVTAPDCNCPLVAPLDTIPNKNICLRDLPITLNIGVGSNQSASWYTSSTNGQSLATNTLSYSPTDTISGTYTYYVEAIDLLNIGCVSSVRTPVTFTILSPPQAMNATLTSCNNFLDGNTSFTLPDANALLTQNPLYDIIYYESKNDANLEIDRLLDEYIINDGIPIIVFARVADNFGCYTIVEVELSPLSIPEAVLSSNDEICIDDGNGSIEISNISQLISTALDQGPLIDTNFYDGLTTGDHIITIIDTNNCENVLPFNIGPGIQLSIDTIVFLCSDEGSIGITTDDTYTIYFNVSSSSISIPNSGFSIKIDGQIIGTYTYGVLDSIVLTADSTIHDIEIEDLQLGCSIFYSSPLLSPCSSDCIYPEATIFINPSNILDCTVTFITLSSLEENNINYEWTFNGVSYANNAPLKEAGTVKLLATNILTGCSSADSLVILNMEDYPLISLAPVDTLTCLNTSITIDGSMSQSGLQFQYNWYIEDIDTPLATNTDILVVDQGGLYYLEIIDTILGCINIDSIVVSENIASPTLSLVDTLKGLCGIDIGHIQVSTLSQTSSILFNWSSTEGTITSRTDSMGIDVIGQGYYYIEAINSLNGCHIEDSVFYMPLHLPLISLNVNNQSCFGISDGFLDLKPIDRGNLPFQYILNGESISIEELTTAVDAGFHLLEIVDANNCTADTSFTIEEGLVWAINLDVQIVFDNKTPTFLTTTTSLDFNDIQSIEWTPSSNLSCSDCLNPEITSPEINNYQVTITDKNGCSSTANVEILIKKRDITVPNIFSPKSGGPNKFFTILLPNDLNAINLEILIYDRWGQKVFAKDMLHNASPESFWDGTMNGRTLSQGVYVYIYKVLLDSNEELIGHGDVMLLR